MKSKRSDSVSFDCTVVRVKTLVDGGKRVELDLPEEAIMQAAAMMEYQRFGALLRATLGPTGQFKRPPKKDKGILEEG